MGNQIDEYRVLWRKPVELQNVSNKKGVLIYDCKDIKSIPTAAGVYVIARKHGESYNPLYIGRAENIQKRVGDHLKELKMMRQLEQAKSGTRVVLIGELKPPYRKKANPFLETLETALIQDAVSKGFKLLNERKINNVRKFRITKRGRREYSTPFSEELLVACKNGVTITLEK